MPGGWQGDQVNVFQSKGLLADQVAMQEHMRLLMQWRKHNKAVVSGKTLHFAPFNDIYVYFRYIGNEKVMVIMNRNEKQVNIDPTRFTEIIGNNKTGKNILSGKVLDITSSFEVPAKTALVLEIN